MRTLDATPFYDLPEAGRLLWADPVRLAREAGLGRVPAARTAEGWALPKAWVDAEAGLEPTDAEALRTYWLARLAPPSRAARRASRPRERLPVERLLTSEEAARRLWCDAARLERLDADGTLPCLRVDGRPCYDAVLVDLLAAEAQGPAEQAEAAQRVEVRRAEVRRWAQAEYTTAEPGAAVPQAAPVAGPPAPHRPAPSEDAGPVDGQPDAPASAPAPTAPPMPEAYRLPADLARAEGFETRDEDA